MTADEAVRDHSGLVYKVAEKFFRFANHSTSFDEDDLVQVGFIGLLKGAARFDESLGYKPSTYFVHMIRGEILRFLRENLSGVRVPREMTYTERMKVVSTSLNQVVVDDGNPIELMQLIPHYEDYSEIEVRDMIDRTCDERQKKIFHLKTCDKSQVEIGEVMGYSQAQV